MVQLILIWFGSVQFLDIFAHPYFYVLGQPLSSIIYNINKWLVPTAKNKKYDISYYE